MTRGEVSLCTKYPEMSDQGYQATGMMLYEMFLLLSFEEH